MIWRRALHTELCASTCWAIKLVNFNTRGCCFSAVYNTLRVTFRWLTNCSDALFPSRFSIFQRVTFHFKKMSWQSLICLRVRFYDVLFLCLFEIIGFFFQIGQNVLILPIKTQVWSSTFSQIWKAESVTQNRCLVLDKRQEASHGPIKIIFLV